MDFNFTNDLQYIQELIQQYAKKIKIPFEFSPKSKKNSKTEGKPTWNAVSQTRHEQVRIHVNSTKPIENP